MSFRIVRARDGRSVDRGGGVRTRYLVQASDAGTTFLTGTTEFDPGSELPFHLHNCGESVFVLEGRARFDTVEASEELAVGEATWVPPGLPHRFANVGPTVMRILWTYGSADATRTLVDTGETFAVGSPRDHRS